MSQYDELIYGKAPLSIVIDEAVYGWNQWAKENYSPQRPVVQLAAEILVEALHKIGCETSLDGNGDIQVVSYPQDAELNAAPTTLMRRDALL